MWNAADLMTTEVTTVSPRMTLGQAIDVLVDEGVSGLPVTDGQGRILGIITEFAMLAVAYDPSVRADPVSEHMTREVISVEDDAPVSQIADLMILHRIRRVLVTHNGRLAGLISRRDVLRIASQAQDAVCNMVTGDPQLSDARAE